MTIQDKEFLSFVNEFFKHELVQGILLSGSRTTGNADKDSDYDLYIYSYQEIPLEFRAQLIPQHLKDYELDNRTWVSEDQGYFKESSIQIDVVYINIDWITEHLKSVLFKGNASTGYTTCNWSNFLYSEILYDKSGLLLELQNRFKVEYPELLRKNIIAKNRPVLNKIIPAYTHQVAKALKRDDIISINHRISAFFESYFDIIFALNKKPHPGEKKLIKILTEGDYRIPENMEVDINSLLRHMYDGDFDVIGKMNKICEKLDELIEAMD